MSRQAELRILWNKNAVKYLTQLHEYIAQESLQNAEKVQHDIIAKVESIRKHPTKFGIDKYKTLNDGSYRYFELHHQRIAFRITNKVIKVLRIRSTYREPKDY